MGVEETLLGLEAALLGLEEILRSIQQSTEIQEGSPTINILVGNYRLRRAERWENIPRVSSEVGEI